MVSNARPHLRHTLLALAACGALSGTTQAATVVWNGIGPNNQWVPTALGPIVASNWLRNGVAAGPQNGDDLLFDSNVRTVSSNDYAALEVRSITFGGTAAAYTLGGNALRVTDYVDIDNGAPQHLGMRVTASRSFRFFAGTEESSLLFLDGGMDMDDGAKFYLWSTVVNQGSDSLVIGKSAASSLELSGQGTTVKADKVIVGKSGGAAAGTSALKVDVWSSSLREATVSATSRVVVGQNAPGRIDTLRGLLSSPFVTLGDGAGISGKAVLNGDSARWQVSDTLEVGRSGTGTLDLSGKARIDTERAVLAAQPTGTATVTLKDAGTRFSVARDLYVGFQNAATVSVLDGALLDATTAYLGWTPSSSATVRVAGGGATLRSTTASVGADGDATLTLETGGKGQFGDLSIHDRGMVIVDGGQLEATTVQMRGGTLRSAAGLDLDVVGNVQGHGVVDGPVQRGAARLIMAEGGTLNLGDSRRGDGFAFDGALEVNGATAVLLDADAAGLGHTTTLRDFGLLQADNGLVLGAGRLLQSFGDTRVVGRLLNDGSVRSEGGQLSFADTVDGQGSFAGDVRFLAGLDTTGGARTLDFGGGTASFGSGSLLVIDLVDAATLGGHDRLTDLDLLVFDGRLQLDFDAGFTTSGGGRFQLFDFASFHGSFDPGRIEVTGFDRNRLDFSRLGVDGSLAIAPVPEPGSSALWIAGLGAMGFVIRRRRPTARGRTEGVAP